MKEKNTWGMTVRESSTSYNNHSNNKEAYTVDSKAQKRKQSLQKYSQTSSEEASIKTAEMTAMRGMQKREETRWVIYTDQLSSMLAIGKNREPSNFKSDM